MSRCLEIAKAALLIWLDLRQDILEDFDFECSAVIDNLSVQTDQINLMNRLYAIAQDNLESTLLGPEIENVHSHLDALLKEISDSTGYYLSSLRPAKRINTPGT